MRAQIEYEANALRAIYAREGSIKRTAEAIGHAYNTTRRLLLEAQIPLNPRGHRRVVVVKVE